MNIPDCQSKKAACWFPSVRLCCPEQLQNYQNPEKVSWLDQKQKILNHLNRFIIIIVKVKKHKWEEIKQSAYQPILSKRKYI